MSGSYRLSSPGSAIRIAVLAGLALLLVGLPMPIPLRALGEGAFMAAAVIMAVLGLARQTEFRLARVAFLASLALYIALLMHSNLPSIKVGLEGIRYAMVALSGLILGLSLPDLRVPDKLKPSIQLIPTISWLLLVAATVSLIVHLFFPDVEESFSRTADISTAVLGGQARMQGLLSGPFHIAMLGSFLTLAGAWQLIRRQPLGLLMLLIGETVLMLARVRSSLIATLIGLLALFALAWFQRDQDPRLLNQSRKRLLTGIAVIPLLVVLIGTFTGNIDQSRYSASGFTASEWTDGDSSSSGGTNAAISQFEGISGDHRTRDRAKAIRRAAELSWESPIVGWGPGAASSGLKPDFLNNGKTQINPHSGVFVLTIEGGFGVLIAFLLIVGSVGWVIWREIRRRSQPEAAGFALAALFPLAIFWLLGDGLSALPVSLCLMLILGVFAAGFANAEVPEATEVKTDGV